MGYDNEDIYGYLLLAVILITAILLSTAILLIESSPGSNSFTIGDEVETTNEYNAIFNDSFTGHVISARNCVYLVRCDNGTEREFVSKWIDNCTPEQP